jgi:hypothetical protein
LHVRADGFFLGQELKGVFPAAVCVDLFEQCGESIVVVGTNGLGKFVDGLAPLLSALFEGKGRVKVLCDFDLIVLSLGCATFVGGSQ